MYLLHTHKEEEGWKYIKRRKHATENICKDVSNKSYRKATKNKTKKIEDLWDKSKTPPQSATHLQTLIYDF